MQVAHRAWAANVHLRTLWFVSSNAVRRHAASSSFWLLLGIAVVIAGASTVSGVSQVRHRISVYEDLVEQKTTDVGRTVRVTGGGVEPTLRVLRTPKSLSAVVAADTATPMFWDFGPGGVRRGLSPISVAATAPTDFDFVIRVLLGLLGVILALDSVAAERASGTLLAVVGQAVRPAVIVLGKFAGAGISLAFATLMIVVTMGMTLVTFGGDLLSPGDIVTVAALGLPAWLYAMCCFAFGVLLATLARSYYIVFAMLLIIWIIVGVNGTVIANLLAQTISPTPPVYITQSNAERLNAKLTQQAQVDIGDEFFRSLVDPQLWQRSQMRTPLSEEMAQKLRTRWIEFSAARRSALDNMSAATDRSAQRQRRLARGLSFVSPGALFEAAASALAGTGAASALRWDRAAHEFQRELNVALFDDQPRITLHVPRTAATLDQVIGRWITAFDVREPLIPASLPHFREPVTRLTERIRDAAVPMLLLMAYIAGMGMVAARVFGTRSPDLWREAQSGSVSLSASIP